MHTELLEVNHAIKRDIKLDIERGIVFKSTYLDYDSDPEMQAELATIHSADMSMNDGGSAFGPNESVGLGSPRGGQVSNAKEREKEKQIKKYKRWNNMPNTAQLMTVKYLNRVAQRELDPTITAFQKKNII